MIYGTSLAQTYILTRLQQQIDRLFIILDVLDSDNHFNTERFVDYFKMVVHNENCKNSIKEFLSEKTIGIDQRFTKLESNIDLRLVQIESLIKRQMAETRFEYFKWMFIFCVFQVNIIIFILLLIKK